MLLFFSWVGRGGGMGGGNDGFSIYKLLSYDGNSIWVASHPQSHSNCLGPYILVCDKQQGVFWLHIRNPHLSRADLGLEPPSLDTRSYS